METILTAVGFMAVLGLILASVLVVANKRLYVFEDPRIDQVEELLPKANCGACGTAGCRQFAEKLVLGEIEPGKCTVNTKEMNQVIADFLGVDLGAGEKRVARLACAGGIHVAYIRASYGGVQSCRGAALVSGGGKGCSWGCLGLGDCAEVCEFDAIHLDKHGLPVVSEDKCTACGDCVTVCPKDLFSLHPVSTAITDVLSSVAGNYDLVYAWDPTSGWKLYDPTLGELNDLKTLDENMGFWIKMNTARTLIVSGTAPSTTNVVLKNGWNLVGYPSSGNLILPDALSEHGVSTDFSLAYAYHASDTGDEWKLFDRSLDPLLNNLTEMAPGWGYWVSVSADHTWHVEY